MSRRPRKKREETYHHGDLRRALVEQALRSIEREGVDALSLREVARTLNVSPRAPYRHFATKEDLLAAVAVEGYAMWGAFLAARLEGKRAPVARLRTAVEAYVAFAVEHPAAFRVMYAPYATVRETAPDLVRVRSEGHEAMLTVIREAQASGAVREGDPMHAALGLWSMMHGLSVLLVEGQLGRYDRPVEAAKMGKLVTQMLFEGLLRRE
ncbi:MAG TPA: TetR/AcrR family transcriptional regulator [Polyangiaceae bacterium]|jgi:AcrR family transcriptional regulator